MTPEELAALHPRLYHVTEPGAHEAIRRQGLLSARAILGRLGIDGAERIGLLERRRPAAVPLSSPEHGRFVLNDNLPLTEKALERCLDDALTPADWLRKLNDQVYLWPSTKRLASLLGARTNRDRPREVIVFDTLSLVGAHATRTRLSPINGGSTIRKPARRGLATYTPLLAHDYRDWRALRGGRDTIAEVAVEGAIPDAGEHIVEVRLVEPRDVSGTRVAARAPAGAPPGRAVSAAPPRPRRRSPPPRTSTGPGRRPRPAPQRSTKRVNRPGTRSASRRATA